jgi:arylsulfatase A-like enzyme
MKPLFLAVAFLAILPQVSLASPPNIIFIFSDDHARHAISAYGSKVNQTPHLDRMAKDGAIFQNAFVTNSICTPSRATLLTGQYSHKNGVPVFNRFDGSRDHMAKRLQSAGYHTGMIGKWHLGSDPTGFDRWIVLPGQGAYWDPMFLVDGKKMTIKGHCTEITTDLGIEFIKTRPENKPFFLMLHHKAPHRAWEPDTRNKEKFANRVIPEPDTLWDTYKTRPAALPSNQQTIARDLTRRDLKLVPPVELKGPELNRWYQEVPMELEVDGELLRDEALVRWKYQRYMQDYLACVQGVDDSVGRVLDYLDESGLVNETIVIYSSDNGWYLGDMGMYDKRFMYEPGLRIPLIMRGPGIRPGIAPEEMVLNIDFAPTILRLAGLEVPASMQGESVDILLGGQPAATWRTSIYYRYYHDPGHHNTRAHLGVRNQTHKLIYYWKEDLYELYDLIADPDEQNNLLFNDGATRNPQVSKLWQDLQAEIVRLQSFYQDDGEFADPSSWPKEGVDGPFPTYVPLGQKTIAEAIALSVPKEQDSGF